MDFQHLWQEITTTVGPFLPKAAAALAILIVGWLIAVIVGAIARGLLNRTTIDNKIAAWMAGEERADEIDIETWIGKAAYYLVMLFTLVAVFQTLELTVVTEPLRELLNRLFAFAPQILGAGVLLLLAWVIATGVRAFIRRFTAAAKLDQRLMGEDDASASKASLSNAVAEAIYWLIFLLFLPAILDTLELQGLLAPVQTMLGELMGHLPNVGSAILIGVAGWFGARIAQRIVSNLLAAVGVDSFGTEYGVQQALGDQKLSKVVGSIAYVLIFLFVLQQALDVLALDAITQPIGQMLTLVFEAIPLIVVATLVLTFAYFFGRFLKGLVETVLTGVGFNNILLKIGLAREVKDGARTPAQFVGGLANVAVLFFASVEAANQLGFVQISGLALQFLGFAGDVLLGLVIFAAGLWLSNLAAEFVKTSGAPNPAFVSTLARTAVLVMAGAMALRRMGLADEIVVIAFGSIIGALAVAAAIAFGIGGREIAARHLEGWTKQIEGGSQKE